MCNVMLVLPFCQVAHTIFGMPCRLCCYKALSFLPIILITNSNQVHIVNCCFQNKMGSSWSQCHCLLQVCFWKLTVICFYYAYKLTLVLLFHIHACIDRGKPRVAKEDIYISIQISGWLLQQFFAQLATAGSCFHHCVVVPCICHALSTALYFKVNQHLGCAICSNFQFGSQILRFEHYVGQVG